MNLSEGIENLMQYVTNSNGVCLNIDERYTHTFPKLITFFTTFIDLN